MRNTNLWATFVVLSDIRSLVYRGHESTSGNYAQEQKGRRSLGTDCNRKGHRRSYHQRGLINLQRRKTNRALVSPLIFSQFTFMNCYLTPNDLMQEFQTKLDDIEDKTREIKNKILTLEQLRYDCNEFQRQTSFEHGQTGSFGVHPPLCGG